MTKGKAQIIRQTRNKLKDKAMRDARPPKPDEATTNGFSEDVVAKLDTAFEEAAAKYPDVALEYLEQLDQAVKGYQQVSQSGADPDKAIVAIHKVAHELKGQGATFGYPLISLFGNSLYKFTKPHIPVKASHSEILKAHADAIRVVITQKISGDGGAVGKELGAMLQKALAQHAK